MGPSAFPVGETDIICRIHVLHISDSVDSFGDISVVGNLLLCYCLYERSSAFDCSLEPDGSSRSPR